MFTGIVEDRGTIKSISRGKDAVELGVTCRNIWDDLRVGDSIAINGVCLSVTKMKDALYFDVVKNTYELTGLKRLKKGDKVNLEGALKMGQALGGHIVSGHVDGERKIRNNCRTLRGWTLDIEMTPEDEKHLVAKGSVAIDGISLTVGEILNGAFRVFIIPHTLETTTLEGLKKGGFVNVEFDVMGKYSAKQTQSSSITEDTLRNKGFI
jgi:riboflavin synthase